MASFLCQVQTIQRSAGRSAVAAAAYRAGELLVDRRLAMEFDFSGKDRIEHAEVMLPAGAPRELGSREALWNGAELAEVRKDAVPARELLLALPHELSFMQRRELVRAFVAEHLLGRGMIADVAMHLPSKEGDPRNFHAHVMVTTRAVGPQGFGAKPEEWWSPQAVRSWRAGWAEIQNEHLRRHLGPDAPQVTHLSLAARGVDREPTVHMGPAATALERRDLGSARGEQNRDVGAHNQMREEIRRDYQETADRLVGAVPMITVPVARLVEEAERVRSTMIAERDGWEAEREGLGVVRVETSKAVERELLGSAARERALAKARLARIEARVAGLRSKRLGLARWVANPARMIWAKHAELNALGRARRALRVTVLQLQVREAWVRSEPGQAYVAARRGPQLEHAADVARRRRTLERKIKRADKRILGVTETLRDLTVARVLGQAELVVPAKVPDETRFIRDVGGPAREAVMRFPSPARQQALERVNRELSQSIGRGLGRVIGLGFLPGAGDGR